MSVSEFTEFSESISLPAFNTLIAPFSTSSTPTPVDVDESKFRIRYSGVWAHCVDRPGGQRLYRSIPAISAEAERRFSSAKLDVTDQRNFLSIQTLEILQCLKSWCNSNAVKSGKTARRYISAASTDLNSIEELVKWSDRSATAIIALTGSILVVYSALNNSNHYSAN